MSCILDRVLFSARPSSVFDEAECWAVSNRRIEVLLAVDQASLATCRFCSTTPAPLVRLSSMLRAKSLVECSVNGSDDMPPEES